METSADSKSASGSGSPAATPICVLGRYALFDPIARGGMATVHIARLEGLAGFARTVAIKRLHAQYAQDPEFVSMFLDEARLAARIRHPNVVPVLDVVAMDHELFLVMEYVQGESFARLMRASRHAKRAIPPRISVGIVSGILHGLHAAHEAKSERGQPLSIVHRDVSPQNVMVGQDGVARILDFGIAKASNRLSTTRDGLLKGKLSYMAPEQLQLRGVDRRTDVYAASVLLWEALTGKELFPVDEPAATLLRILNDEIPPVSTVNASVPRVLDAIVAKGLARSVDDRYASAREMALELEKAVVPPSASQVTTWLEQIAGRELKKRAEMVAEIESVSVHSLADRPRQPPREPLAAVALASDSGVNAISAPGLPSDPPEAGSGRIAPVESALVDLSPVETSAAESGLLEIAPARVAPVDTPPSDSIDLPDDVSRPHSKGTAKIIFLVAVLVAVAFGLGLLARGWGASADSAQSSVSAAATSGAAAVAPIEAAESTAPAVEAPNAAPAASDAGGSSEAAASSQAAVPPASTTTRATEPASTRRAPPKVAPPGPAKGRTDFDNLQRE